MTEEDVDAGSQFVAGNSRLSRKLWGSSGRLLLLAMPVHLPQANNKFRIQCPDQGTAFFPLQTCQTNVRPKAKSPRSLMCMLDD